MPRLRGTSNHWLQRSLIAASHFKRRRGEALLGLLQRGNLLNMASTSAPVEDYRFCPECNQTLSITCFKSRGKYFKSCHACRELRARERRDNQPKGFRLVPVCTKCGSPASARQLSGPSKEVLIKHHGEMLCEKCFMGEEVPLKLEDFMRSGADVYEGVTPMSTGSFTKQEQKTLKSYNYRHRVRNVAG
jgi:hypothetical protein